MFWSLISFEFKYFKSQPSSYVIALILFLLAFGAMASVVHFGASNANVNYNSPFAVSKLLVVMSYIAMFTLANFVGMSAIRDYEHRMTGLVFSMPISKGSYLWGRLAGVISFSLVLFLIVPLAALLAEYMPWMDTDRLTETNYSAYISTYLIFVIPNFILVSSLFYAFAIFFKSMKGMYLAMVGFFVLNVLAGNLIKESSLEDWMIYVDPFGMHTFNQVTQYWTAFEMNTQVVQLEGLVLENRLFWLAVAAMVILLTHLLVNLRQTRKEKQPAPEKVLDIEISEYQPVTPSHSFQTEWTKLVYRTQFEIGQILKTPSFIILVLLILANLLMIIISPNATDNEWPLTRTMSDYIMGSFSILFLIIITYSAAESVWREKELSIGDIIEATPVSNWALYFPKVIALFLVSSLLLLVAVIFTVVYQISQSYYQFEFDIYLLRLVFIFLLPVLMLSSLSILLQVILPNKYLGMFVFTVYIITTLFFSLIGIEHTMWDFGSLPDVMYSDMNRFGHYVEANVIYSLYWLGLSSLLLILGYGLYQRGKEYAIGYRLRQLPRNIGRGGMVGMALSMMLFVGMGSYIHYNTKILNDFISIDEMTDLRVDYEQKYKPYQDLPIAKITAVNINVDIYPDQRKIIANGYYLIKNKHNENISKMLVYWSDKNQVSLKMAGASLKDYDKTHQTGWLHFEPALKPNETRKLNYKVVREHHGFVDQNDDTTLVYNGTFINNFELLPHFGYNQMVEITSRKERKERGIGPAQRANKLEDSTKYRDAAFGKSSDFIDYQAVISTSLDQTAITSGYLQKQWQENGRNYFHYKMDAPIHDFFAFLSGKYQLTEEIHNGVKVAVYYHPAHDMNVQKMIDAVKLSLDIYSREFSPYQHKQVQIIEFPRYRSFAQSFPNTVPFSESMGFITDLRNAESDKVSFVTAHEIAHQWWGHQIMPADVQGGQVLSESLAEYSAYLVYREIYGEHKLRIQLNREQKIYLAGRDREILEEMPLMKAENQAYIHYFKGGLVMYAIADRIGEKTFHQALRNLLAEFKFQSNPYPTTLDLIRHIKAVANKKDYELIDDLFKRITLFNLKAVSANAKKLTNGNYQIELIVEAKKFYADGKGQETQAELDQPLDIGFFIKKPTDKSFTDEDIIKVVSKRINHQKTKLTYEVKIKPNYAGIDPYLKMIDRNREDNLVEVELVE